MTSPRPPTAVSGTRASTSARSGTSIPATGTIREIPLGSGSAPHGVIVGPDGAAWITDGGLNAIVRVDPATSEVKAFPLPGRPPGRQPQHRRVRWRRHALVHRAERASTAASIRRPARSPSSTTRDGRGPYGITATPAGEVWYASLAGSHIARIDRATGAATVVEPPTAGQGARRVWSDSTGRIWVAEWNAGQLGVYDPSTGAWQEWKLPGDGPQAYAVYVDERDIVWLTDFGANAIVRFDPATERFDIDRAAERRTRPCASCLADRASCGAPNRPSTSSSSSPRAEHRR